MSNPGKNAPFSGETMAVFVQGRLEVFTVVLMLLGYFSGTTIQLFSTLGDPELLPQELCTMGRDKPNAVKHQLFTAGSLQSP